MKFCSAQKVSCRSVGVRSNANSLLRFVYCYFWVNDLCRCRVSWRSGRQQTNLHRGSSHVVYILHVLTTLGMITDNPQISVIKVAILILKLVSAYPLSETDMSVLTTNDQQLMRNTMTLSVCHYLVWRGVCANVEQISLHSMKHE